MGYLSHRVDPTEIKPGDHIYTWRSGFVYSHHGIYVGEKMVIHFNRTPEKAEKAEKADSGSVWGVSSSSFTSHYASCLNSHDCGFLQPSTGGDCGSDRKVKIVNTGTVPQVCTPEKADSGSVCGVSSSSFTGHYASCLSSHDCGFLQPSTGGDCGSDRQVKIVNTGTVPQVCTPEKADSGSVCGVSSSSFTGHYASCLNSHDCDFLQPSTGEDCGSDRQVKIVNTGTVPQVCTPEKAEKADSGSVCGVSSSSFTGHYASCLNSHDCGFLQPSTGGDCGSDRQVKIVNTGTVPQVCTPEKAEKADSGSVCGVSSSSFTGHYASCLNSHDCGFLQPSTGGDCGSDREVKTVNTGTVLQVNDGIARPNGLLEVIAGGLSTCSHCTSWNPDIPAACLGLPHCGYHQPDSGVFISCLNCFIDKGSLYRFQYGVRKLSFVSKVRGGTCTTAISDPPDEVIERALYLLLHGFGSYDVVKNNCEDFALYCTTALVIRGKATTGSSGQVNFFANAPWKSTIIFGVEKCVSNSFGIVTMVATNVGIYSWNRYKTDIGVRDDVVKVPVEEVVEFRRRNM